MATEEEYREIFHAEANENQEELNRLFSVLEKDHSSKKSIDAIFRITHTLKGNALGMGFKPIGAMAHALEDIFGEIRSGNLELDDDIFGDLYKGLDTLTSLIDALQSGEKIKYLGIKTKLGVILRNLNENKEKEGESEEKESPKEEVKKAPAKKAAAKKPKKKEEKKEEPVQEEVAEEIDFDKVVEQPVAEEEVKEEVVEEAEEVEEEDTEEEEVKDEAPKISFSDLVQVPVRKLDELMNLVGELVIERDRIMQLTVDQAAAEGKRSNVDFSRLVRITSDLQYSVMDVRLVQISFLFNKFHRVVRDAANVEKKKVNLVLEGTDTEIDRNVLSIISDSMIHLVRNCVGHGVELPEVRKKAGKDEMGTITLRARNESDNVVIDIVDDGGGINPKVIAKKAIEKGLTTKELIRHMTDQDIIMFIFEPGFSSMETVTAISGRGVGMDVVKKSIDSIGGTVQVQSKVGQGSTITLFLPSSMAVKGALLFDLDNQEYAIPLSYTEAVVSFKKSEIHKVSQGLMATYLEKTISIVFLRDLFDLNDEYDSYEGSTYHQSFDSWPEEKQLHVVVVHYNGKDVGFVVDKLLQQKEIVEKPLMKPVDQVKLISGVTILGNGNVCLVINVLSIVQHIFSYGVARV